MAGIDAVKPASGHEWHQGCPSGHDAERKPGCHEIRAHRQWLLRESCDRCSIGAA
jgi:hypothetical protein